MFQDFKKVVFKMQPKTVKQRMLASTEFPAVSQGCDLIVSLCTAVANNVCLTNWQCVCVKTCCVLFSHRWYGVHAVVTLHQFIFGGHAVLSFPHSWEKQHTESKQLCQSDLIWSHSSCEKSSSGSCERLVKINYYTLC